MRGFESLLLRQDKLTSFERNLSIFFLQKSQKVYIKYQAVVKLTTAIFYAEGGFVMKGYEKSERIKAGLRKEFQNGSSKMEKRKCYGHHLVLGT